MSFTAYLESISRTTEQTVHKPVCNTGLVTSTKIEDAAKEIYLQENMAGIKRSLPNACNARITAIRDEMWNADKTNKKLYYEKANTDNLLDELIEEDKSNNLVQNAFKSDLDIRPKKMQCVHNEPKTNGSSKALELCIP